MCFCYFSILFAFFIVRPWNSPYIFHVLCSSPTGRHHWALLTSDVPQKCSLQSEKSQAPQGKDRDVINRSGDVAAHSLSGTITHRAATAAALRGRCYPSHHSHTSTHHSAFLFMILLFPHNHCGFYVNIHPGGVWHWTFWMWWFVGMLLIAIT